MNIQEYSVACATSFESKKSASAIAREVGVGQSTASRFLKELDIEEIDFLRVVKTLFGRKKVTLVIDDSTIPRRYAQHAEGTSSMIDQSTKTFTNGFKIVVAGLTDGKHFLPIDLEHWIAEFIVKDQYNTKPDLAKKLVMRILDLGIFINHVVLDGLYFSQDFILFLDANKIEFTIKAKTTTSVSHNGIRMQLQDCEALRLNSNQNQKTIVAEWGGKKWYFTAVRRSGKHGNKIIYLISNFKTKSRFYRQIYDSRWTIEKFLRTGKQFLGLNDSLSLNARIYLNHIKCVFFAYGLLQILMKKFKLKSVEEAIRLSQSLKSRLGFSRTVDQISLLECYA